jgi:hypothetical protein
MQTSPIASESGVAIASMVGIVILAVLVALLGVARGTLVRALTSLKPISESQAPQVLEMCKEHVPLMGYQQRVAALGRMLVVGEAAAMGSAGWAIPLKEIARRRCEVERAAFARLKLSQ